MIRILASTTALILVASPAFAMKATGCLGKGEERGTVQLLSPQGRFDLAAANDDVDFSEHVGHEITVSGEKQPAEGDGNPQIAVEVLKHLSKSCP